MNDRKIVHLVIDLSGFGGAEMTLLRYLSAQNVPHHRHHILALRRLRPGASVGHALEARGIPITFIGIDRLAELPAGLIRLLTTLRGMNADVLSAWLYYPALIATLLRPLLPGRPDLIWHIRSLPYGRFIEKPMRWLAQRCLAPLSYASGVRIISNSHAAKKAHRALGYDDTRWEVIPNAVEADRYHPDDARRAQIRNALSIPSDGFVIGAVGRDVPEKAWPDLIEAFAILYHQLDDARKNMLRLVIAGRGVSKDTPHFRTLLDAVNLPDSAVTLLGVRDDIPDLLRAFDLFVMPSRSESFPNALVEAMASGLPCIATDVGDCARVLDDESVIVNANQPPLLAKKLALLFAESKEARAARGEKNRARAVSLYAPDAMITAFAAAYTVS